MTNDERLDEILHNIAVLRHIATSSTGVFVTSDYIFDHLLVDTDLTYEQLNKTYAPYEEDYPVEED